MSLRRTTLAFFIFTTLGLLAVSLVSLNRILKPHFLDQQKAEVSLNLLRTEKALQQQIANLAIMNAEWASFPTLQTGFTPGTTNIVPPGIAADLDLIFLYLIDSNGNILLTQQFDEDQATGHAVMLELRDQLKPGSPLLAAVVDSQPLNGLIELDGLPVLLVSSPVADVGFTGKMHGSLIVGSLFDPGAKEHLNEMLQIDVSLISADLTANQAEPAVALQEITASGQPYILLTQNVVSGYSILPDVLDKPSFLLKIEQYPSIYHNGELIFNYLILALIMSGVTSITILFLLIEGNVLNRLRRISEDVTAVGQSGDINRRLKITRKDELGQLGGAINRMLTDLQQATLQRQESEERFQKLVESMDDIVFTIDRETNRVQVYGKNASKSTHLAGAPLTEQLNLLIRELGDQITAHKEVLEKSYAGENTGLEWATLDHGRERNYYATLSPMVNSQGEITTIVGVSRDITDIKRLEKDLRQRVDEFSALYETSQLLLSQMDIEATQDSICFLAIEKMGLDSAWIGRINAEGARLEPVASHTAEVTDLSIEPLNIETAPTSHPAVQAFLKNDIQVENRILVKLSETENTLVPVSMASIPLTQGSRILAVLTVIKDQPGYFTSDHLKLVKAFANLSGLALQNTYLFKQVSNGRERLQSVSRRLVEVQEEERRKIALELHDEIGQILTGLRFSVDMINTLPADKIAEHIRTIMEIITDLISKVRQMSLDLRPSMLDDLGIGPTIIWHIDRYSSQTGILVNFHQTNVQNRRFRSDIETTIYRVVQEALTNIARHANVKTANVRLWCTDKILGVQIEDEGQGFDPDEALSAHRSRGLLGMRERVGFIGGQLSIVSQPGQGASLTIEIPLEGHLERRTHGR